MSNIPVGITINVSGNANNNIIKLTNNVSKATSGFQKLVKGASMFGQVAIGIAAAVRAVNALNSRVKGLTDSYLAEATAITKLTAIMRNRLNATNAEIDSIVRLAAEQQRLGVIGDEVQIAAAQELMQYARKSDSIKKLMPVMNDYLAQQYGVSASQEQAKQTADLFGKVLSGNTGILSRYGIYLSDAQEKILKTADETARAAVIAKLFASRVGGVNIALAQTPEGKQAQIANNMSDIGERLGGIIVRIKSGLNPAMNTLIEKVNGFLDKFEAGGGADKIAKAIEKIISFLTDNIRIIGVLVGAWVSYIAIAKIVEIRNMAVAFYTDKIGYAMRWVRVNTLLLSRSMATGSMVSLGFTKNIGRASFALIRFGTVGIFNALKGIGALILSFITGGAASATFAGIASVSFAAFALSAKIACKTVSTAIYNIPIIGWIAAIIALVIGAVKLIVKGIKMLWDKSEGFRRVVFGIGEAFKAFFHNIGAFFTSIWDGIKSHINAVAGLHVYIFNKIKSAFMPVVDFFKSAWERIKGIFSSAWNWVTGVFSKIGSWFMDNLINPIKNAFISVWDFVKGIFNKMLGAMGKIFAPIRVLWNKLFPKSHSLP